MANTARLRLNIDNLRHTISIYGVRVVREAVVAVRTTVDRTIERTTNAAPDFTGELKRNIKGTVRSDGYSVTGRVRVGVPYAAHLEFGTENMDAHPHLVPAAVDERKVMQDALEQLLVDLAPPGLGTPRITGHQSPLPGIDIE